MPGSREELAARLDLTELRADADRAAVEELCRRAREHGCAAVVVAPRHVETAAAALEGSGVAPAAAVAFPFGATTLSVKLFEALQCELLGARELDIVLDHAAVRGRDRRALRREVSSIMEKTPEVVHKFILEARLVDEAALRAALKVLNRARPAFVKTGTGLHGAVRPEDVAALRRGLEGGIGIKAAGGVRSLEQIAPLVEAGADRIGTSAGVEILEALREAEEEVRPGQG